MLGEGQLVKRKLLLTSYLRFTCFNGYTFPKIVVSQSEPAVGLSCDYGAASHLPPHPQHLLSHL